jgi:hypothetical protein
VKSRRSASSALGATAPGEVGEEAAISAALEVPLAVGGEEAAGGVERGVVRMQVRTSWSGLSSARA